MRRIKIEDAVGMVLAHDITRIVPGKFKGVGFKKGHVIREEDIQSFLELGKQHLYVFDLPPNHIHEDDAAIRIAKAICSDAVEWTKPSEGKSSITSKQDGLLKINTAGLLKINNIGEIIVSTLRNNNPCKKNQVVAATRIIPLSIPDQQIGILEKYAMENDPIINILPFRKLSVGAIVTGTEIYKEIITDEFDRYMGNKIRKSGCELKKKILVPDDTGQIAWAVNELIGLGCDLIITTGGLSVDPDDVTKSGIMQAGAKLIKYGAPVLPGAMFLYAVLGETPILGLSACVYYHPITIFDIIFPRILAGDKITADEIAGMGHGGLCMNCAECRFPVCSFGR